MAGVMEMAVFVIVDPQDLHLFNQTIDLSRQGVYTLSFFIFWTICAASSGLSLFLFLTPKE
jgi:hypothetical protein